MQGAWVWSLVGELRSHMPCGMAKKKSCDDHLSSQGSTLWPAPRAPLSSQPGNSCFPLFTSLNPSLQSRHFLLYKSQLMPSSKPLVLPLFGTLLTPSTIWALLTVWALSHHPYRNLQESLQFNTSLDYTLGCIPRSLHFGASLASDIHFLKND